MLQSSTIKQSKVELEHSPYELMVIGWTPKFTVDSRIAENVAKLIFGRLAIAFIILLAGLWWVTDRGLSLGAISSGYFLLFFAVVVLSALYLIWLRLGRKLIWQIRTQFLIDALLITVLVGATGGLISPYITLYIILISVAGFFLGKMDAHAVAAACVLSFSTLALLITQGLVKSSSGEMTASGAAQVVGFNVAAFLFVGLLAGRLADRRKIGEELKQAETNFANLNVLHERILASINSGLITTDLQGKIYAFNRAAEEISGFAANETIGRSIFSVFGDEIRPSIERCLGSVQTVEFSPPNFDAAIRMPNNGNGRAREIKIACTVSPLVGKSGGVTGLIVTIQDKTELRAMEESLRQSDRLAAVGRMAAGLAHEIRNPLGSMSSALQFLSEKAKPDTEDAALMSVVLSESDRLNGIITDFLTYARPRPNPEANGCSRQTDIGEDVKDCLALLRHNPAVNELHEFDFVPPERPVMIHADGARAKQVFWNLFQNSVQAMPNGGRLSVAIDEPVAGRVRITVSDTGKGISSDELGRIFEPFHSGSNGTGLGLSIVHRLVTEHGGNIDVQSELGEGTTFTLELPK